MSPGPLQLLLVLVLVLLLFGSSRVPGIMENLAKGIQSFKKGMKDEDAPKKSITDKSKEKDQP
ncbi:MAG TPA: twin-arginine translocase TatA/TatE family subunit [Rhodospirillaceae bacterium]|nr:twin-arginine translocase TatA/TatE family subunit [Rhodospirillaceae bacterium]